MPTNGGTPERGHVKNYKNILIIKMSSLGDVLHALPTLAALRENYPTATITWAVHKEFSAVLPDAPYIDNIIYIDKKKLTSLTYLRELRKKMQAYHFDMSLDLQCLAKSALVALLSGAKERFGYWETREGSWLINKGLVGPHKYDHVIERYLDTVRVLGGTVSDIQFPLADISDEMQSVKAKLTAAGVDGPYVVMVPGARWAVKEWPPEYFAQVGNAMGRDGYRVILAGTADDGEKAKRIIEAGGQAYYVDMTGQTNLKELMALIKGSALYISADTGPLHLANALQKPLIALFGTTSPQRTGPYGSRRIHILVSPTSKATPEAPLVDDPECMKALLPETVIERYRSIREAGELDG